MTQLFNLVTYYTSCFRKLARTEFSFEICSFCALVGFFNNFEFLNSRNREWLSFSVLKTSEKLENVAILLTTLNQCTLMVESVLWLSKLHYYSSRIVPSRKSLMIDFCCEVASLFSNNIALGSALYSYWSKCWRIVLLSNQKRVFFLSANRPDATSKTGRNLRRFLWRLSALSQSIKDSILGGIVFFTENIMG